MSTIPDDRMHDDTTMPDATMPAGTKHDYRTIVVGTDGSALAGPTVARAAWLAAHDDADLVIVCAYAKMPRRDEARNVASLGGDPRVGQVPGRSAATGLSDAVALAKEHGATISAALLIDAEPSAAPLAAVSERDADLVVVGARRDTSVAERLLGTVATEVVKRASCDVLVVRPRESAQPTE